MNKIKYYLSMGNCRMVIRLVIMHVKLWWMVKCNCPFGEDHHRVEVMYWARTQYYWDGKGLDPNGPILICKAGADECIKYWDDMWNEYYSSVM